MWVYALANESGEAGGDCDAWHEKELKSMTVMPLSTSRVYENEKRRVEERMGKYLEA